ncbi:MAG: electron transfer flavoprotein-ubiquinone oxidoreductase [Desulfobacterales bacterium]|jgi:electron-transferring-flavoprotein dehydrogenase|nr:electron transfer flavoprotein-ubiquinone oxidoreductase [Desulfobacterales bacterium]MDH4010092.1 electron transfer flavoprotein-ubiquinone oxidoreductase [Desulfobacterales bacterium]
MTVERESIDFDVLFVGGGPASLAGAIKLMQLAKEKNLELEVALIEKGAEIGSHALSGAVMDPTALNELMPDYADKGCPTEATVRGDEFYYLTENSAIRVPFVPKPMHNTGSLIISLSRFTRWLGQLAEEMGVNIFPGFTGKEVLYADDGKTIVGVRTGDQGIGPDGEPKSNFEPGIDLKAKVTVFGEGARGSLFKEIDKKLNLMEGKMPQVFETGIEEVIELPEASNYFKTSKGNDIHLMGYPIGLYIPGGAFIYQMSDNRLTLGFLTGLCYEDPLLDLYETYIKFKSHPFVANLIKGGKVVEAGARAVATGGYYTMPKLAVDGGLFVGATAGIQYMPGLKGIHVSMKSGMLAAEAIMTALEKESFDQQTLQAYSDLFENSYIKAQLYEGRNFYQALSKTNPMKFIHLGAQYFTGGRGFVDNMSLEEDYKTLKPLDGEQVDMRPAVDPKIFDGELFVDKLTSVYLSKTKHREDQPSHIIVHDTDLCVNTCYPKYRSPCTRFCPGDVYEIEVDDNSGERRLKLNPSNCLHCKTCDIKDPYENITWTCPEGGEGPGYTLL